MSNKKVLLRIWVIYFYVKGEGVATSVDFVNSEKSKIIASFGSTHHNLYDIETSKLISKFDYYDSKISNTKKKKHFKHFQFDDFCDF